MFDVMTALEAGSLAPALELALAWSDEAPGDVVALLALGEALERNGLPRAAARAYGSLVDLYPARAELRRHAESRLERLGELGRPLAIDSYRRAIADRPDHHSGHRMLAYALLRAGQHDEAWDALLAGLAQDYPEARFAGVERILREDLGIVAAAWLRAAPKREPEIRARVALARTAIATEPSTRFVMTWETDANDVDFHVYDGQGGHASYRALMLPSGGSLYADVTNGYGPECFTIEGVPQAFPYRLEAHYYSRGPMGYGMGALQRLEHDGQGGLRFDDRPFLIMKDEATVELGTYEPTSLGLALGFGAS